MTYEVRELECRQMLAKSKFQPEPTTTAAAVELLLVFSTYHFPPLNPY